VIIKINADDDNVMAQSPLDAFPADPDRFEEGSYCDRRLERAALAEGAVQYAQKVAPGTEGPRECGNMYAGGAEGVLPEEIQC
jgi:hypothetical protein